MIVYLLAAAFAVGALVGGGGVNWWKDASIARHEKQQAEAQAVIDEQGRKIAADAANKQIDMTAAYEAGEANAKTVTRTVYVKGQQLVASTPAFSNPACDIGADPLRLLNAQRQGAGVSVAANTGGADAAMPGAGAATGRQNGDSLSGPAVGRGNVPNVQPAAGGAGSGGQVSGASPRRVPENPLKP